MEIGELRIGELRSGNYLLKDGLIVKIDPRSIFDIWDSNGLIGYKGIEITPKNFERFDIYPNQNTFSIKGLFLLTPFGDAYKVKFWTQKQNYADELAGSFLIIRYIHEVQNLVYDLCHEELIMK